MRFTYVCLAAGISIVAVALLATMYGHNRPKSPQHTTVVCPTLVPGTLPPDPGEAGKESLEGVDCDRDGVRDDIQRWIALTYPDSEKTRAALTVVAKNRQLALLNADNKSLSIELANESIGATE
jgi:hypothetical protein